MRVKRNTGLVLILALMIILLSSMPVLAAQELKADTGNTAFIIICSALVLLMTPGLAFFYGGMVRKKNVLSIMMQCLVVMSLVSVQWVLLGYTLAFGPDLGSIIGNLDYLGLHGVSIFPVPIMPVPYPIMFCGFSVDVCDYYRRLNHWRFCERMRFSAFILFVLLWTTLVYDPEAHWVWGGGWLGQLGLDFAEVR